MSSNPMYGTSTKDHTILYTHALVGERDQGRSEDGDKLGQLTFSRGHYTLLTVFTSTALIITSNLFVRIGLSDSTEFPGQKLLGIGKYQRIYKSPSNNVIFIMFFQNNNVPPHPNTSMNIQTPPVPNSEKTTPMVNEI